MSGYGPPAGPPPGGGYGPPPGGGYGPPPGGGYGPPPGGGYGPPPGGGYGPPPGGGYGAPRTGFNFGAVNPLDWGILAAVLLAFIFSFIDFYNGGAEASDACPPQVQSQIDAALSQSNQDLSATAWHGFFGWF